jgi:hypothetical protein
MNIGAAGGHEPQLRWGAVAGFIDSRLQRGRVAFALSDLTETSGLSTLAARRQLARLDSRVTRVAPRQQFFLIVSPEHRVLGAPPAIWWLDAYFRWLQRPYYLALQSAAAEYGSASQAIQVTQVMTDRPRRALQLGRVRVQFFVKRTVGATPVQAVAAAHAPLMASTPEATALDLVGYASRIGGVARAAETLAPMLGRMRRTALARALAADGDGPTAQRLGYLLEVLGGRALAATVRAHLPRDLARVLLDRASPAPEKPVVSERWAIVVNASVKARR